MSARSFARELRRSPPLNDPRALCASLGLKARFQARGALVCCPTHDDRSPSCSVFLAKDETVAAKCHACGWSGDALGLIAAVHGLDARRDWRRVVDEAARLAPIVVQTTPPVPPRWRELATTPCDNQTYHAVWSFALDLCSPLCTTAPNVARYLEQRRVLADADAAGVRGLPTNTRSLVRALLATFERATLEQVGLLRRGRESLDWPDWPVLIPWRDRFGQITCVQKRRLDGGVPKYRSPVGRSPRAPFGVDSLAESLRTCGGEAEVVLVEGALDALSRRRIARHRRECVAVLGVYSAATPCAGLPSDLLAGRSIVLALDADDAGERACVAIARELCGVAGSFVRERPPQGVKDWNATIEEASK